MYTPKRLSSKSVELARIRRILPPPPEQAPETEPRDSHLKLKEINISTMSHEDSVDKQPASRVYSIGTQSRHESDGHIIIYTCNLNKRQE